LKVKLQHLFNVFLLFLPFTQALTINVFFPLKISEILLFLLVLTIIWFRLDKNHLRVLTKPITLLPFIVLATASFLINIFWKYDYSLTQLDFRIGQVPDSLLRLIYIYLNVMSFFISFYLYTKGKNKALSFWVIGAVIASIYGWYLFLSSTLNIPYIKLFGMEENPQALNGIIRCGTFKEGNFFGLYLLLSASIAFHLKKTKTAWFLMASILMTFSTVSLISACLYFLILSRKGILKKSVINTFIMLLPLVVLGSIYFFKSDFYQKYVYEKLFTPVHKLTPANLSKVDRYLSSRIAFKQGIDNPILGVGPFNYSLHYQNYNDVEKIVKNHSEWSLNYFNRKNTRKIPNNVYMEVWAEYGILGFLLFSLFLLSTLLVSIKNRNHNITAGLLSMYLSFNAFPSFIMLFIWTYFAIPYALAYKRYMTNINQKSC